MYRSLEAADHAEVKNAAFSTCRRMYQYGGNARIRRTSYRWKAGDTGALDSDDERRLCSVRSRQVEVLVIRWHEETDDDDTTDIE